MRYSLWSIFEIPGFCVDDSSFCKQLAESDWSFLKWGRRIWCRDQQRFSRTYSKPYGRQGNQATIGVSINSIYLITNTLSQDKIT
jgi:hypothetical protein